MENVIPTRIYSFLKDFPPFSLLEKPVLLEIAAAVKIRYLVPNEYIFRIGEHPGEEIYVVREGLIQLWGIQDGEKRLVDVCDEGDLFGLRPILAERSYALNAQAEEESLVYAIPVEVVQRLLEKHPKISWYLAQSFASGLRQRLDHKNQGQAFIPNVFQQEEANQLIEIQSIQHSKQPITCKLTTSIQDAAKIMRHSKVGSVIVVDEHFYPKGIVTDKDLRNKVATGDFPLSAGIGQIMTSPVVTIPPEQTVASVQIEMMHHHIHHLCVTADGTSNSKVLGVLSEHDLLVIQGNNPAVFIREIRRSEGAENLRRIREKAEVLLRKYLSQEVAINFICNMITEVNDALIFKAVELGIRELEASGITLPDVPWCWLALGSEGRKEQLLRTDQDNALIFGDVPEAELAVTKKTFLQLAIIVTRILNECGFEYCPGEMMASNPSWCLSFSEWKNQFSEWILRPTEKNIMLCTIFFDFRPIYGEFSLAQGLTQHIYELTASQSLFFANLVKNALQNPPPLTFFRNLVVEKSGEHKNEFDIKGRAMIPLADAARILILEARAPHVTNTFQRFDRMAEIEPKNKELFEQAADAYEILVRYRALQGLKNKNTGRYFNPADLTKMQRLNLRNSFRPIRDLQEILKIRFRVNLLM